MKKLFLFVFLLAIPALCLASFNAKNWQYHKDINFSSGGLVNFSLDNEIFSNARADLADLRIISNHNQEVPYKLIVSRDKYDREKFYPKMLNNSFVPGEGTSVILEFKEGNKEINQLNIITPSENFQRNVKIYGSESVEKWKILNDSAYIYDYTDKKGSFKSQNTRVDFPKSVYKYIKIEISDFENDSVKIAKVEAVKYTEEKSKKIERRGEFFVNENLEEAATEVVLDLGVSGIPTNEILFEIGDKNFNRSLIIYTSSDKYNWKSAGNGYVFSYNTNKFTGKNTRINFSETNRRYIKIVIRNKDNQPLNILDVITFSIYREVIFQAEVENKYRVYYGNAKAKFSEYDLDKYFQYLDLDNSVEAKLSKENNNSLYVPENEPEKPLTERSPYVLPSALIAACLILIFLVYRFFKKG